jgi:hypothetical protein
MTAPLPQDPATAADEITQSYGDGSYWAVRADMMYYHYVDFILRTVGRDAGSLIDVGTANCPYLEWFDWIPTRVSFDRAPPYRSETVTGLQGDFITHDFDRRFDVCTCLQVLEHVPDPAAFARKLLRVADVVVVSVPFMWGAGTVADHVNDPIGRDTMRRWFGRRPNYAVVVEEPFRKPRRLIAVYEPGRKGGYGRRDFKDRVIRDRTPGAARG